MTAHNELIQEVVAKVPNSRTHGFKQQTVDAIKRTMGRAWNRYREQEYLSDLNFVPDAYVIDRQNKRVTVYEVEVSNPLRGRKLAKLVYAWFCLEDVEWDLQLVLVNRFGGQSEVCLATEWHKSCENIIAH